jgi:hypothetical protein
LRGLWSTAPYLHDGSAQTLRDVFTPGPDGRFHALGRDAEKMTAEDLDNLLAYLLQIDDDEPAPAAQAPHIRIVKPAPGQTFATGQAVPISVDAQQITGEFSHVEFYADGALIGSDNTPIFRLRWADAPPGTHDLVARLVYTNGLSATSGTVHVTVTQ